MNRHDETLGTEGVCSNVEGAKAATCANNTC